MQLTEQHIIKSNNLFFKECDELTLKSKNLYNSCLYIIKQAYLKDNLNLIYDLHHLMKDTEVYKELPAKVSSAVIIMVQQNFKSYFKALNSYIKNPKKFTGRPKLPKYLDKTDGRFVVSYTNQAISKKIFKVSNKIKLSKTNIEFKTNITDFSVIDCIRIIPKNGYYVIELVYTIKEQDKLVDNDRYLAIDLGLNNLATLTSNDKNIVPINFNGKPLKSMNQYYNKKKSKLQSNILKVEKQYYNKKKEIYETKTVQIGSTKRLNILHLKRKNKVDNYLHKISKEIVKIAKINNLNTIIIGKNDNWKQDINIGKKNNQNFVNIPHSRFIQMINYKCEIEGINCMLQEESYTSKASFLDLDNIPIYNSKDKTKHRFSGTRIKRGLYQSKSKRLINSDVNGSYNILRKAIPNAFADGIEGFGVNPITYVIKK